MTAIVDFEEFLRNLKLGQPLNRRVLAQDDVRGVLRDQDPKNAQLTPQLAKARQVELAQRLTQAPTFAPAPNPEVAVTPPPPQEVKQETPQRQEPRPPVPATTAPQLVPEQTAALPAAPMQGQRNPIISNAVPTWKTQIVALLERNKRYPAAAQARGEKGTAQLAFSLDRQGRVMASRIVKSSGSAALDQETLELVRRAQPFPPPPAAMPGAHVDLTVPIRFNMH